MAHKIVQIDFVFAHVRFASHAREKMAIERYTLDEVAVVSGISATAISAHLSAQHKNVEMKTFLGICNALDLNPINYFDLME